MSVHEQDGAYKRGVVLGLTLAEVVILVVFSLLLLFAATWKSAERAQQADPDAAREQALAQIAAELEVLRGEKPIAEIWREIRRSYQERTQRGEARAATTASGEEVKRLVLAEMDAARGPAALDAYWRELRWAREDAQLRERAAAVLVDRMQTRLTQAESALRTAQVEMETRRSDGRGEHDWPPIIRLSEADHYYFRTNEAVLSREFENRLREETVPRILALATEYNVNVIEVIGHTDEQRIQIAHSNLDSALLSYLADERGAPLQAADNAGLGMARAAAVTRFLLRDPRLIARKLSVLPLSAGQAIDASGVLADGKNPGDVRERRRIEIRLRRPERPTPG
jgi:flagellar motor protein MotB